jgi:two-component system, OmpR family, response regulator ChvI
MLNVIELEKLEDLMSSDVAKTRLVVFGITENRESDIQDIRLLKVGDLEISFDMCLLLWKGRSIEISVKCLRIVHRLALRPGIVRTRLELLDEIQDRHRDVYDRTIDQHIKRIRQAFRRVDPSFNAIETLYGMGWRWRRESDQRI